MKNYYVMSNGRVCRNANTLWIETAAGEKKPIPVEDVESLYLYGEVDINTKLLNFLSQKRIPLHVFNYYGFYAGSYYPRDYLHSGFLLVNQVAHYQDTARRLILAQELVRGAGHSLRRNVAYYARRRSTNDDDARDPQGEIVPGAPEDPDMAGIAEAAVDAWADVAPSASSDEPETEATAWDDGVGPWEHGVEFNTAEPPTLIDLHATLVSLGALVDSQSTVDSVRGIEGKMRERYYRAWPNILTRDWAFQRRVRRPPDNEINALISFGNSILYTACLSEIYRTQLTPTISYLHEPGARRFSLALDVSEIFKPLIVDRAIFRMVNTGQLESKHFDKALGGCYLTDAGKKLFVTGLEERLNTTIRHRRLGRHVTYRHLIRLECYKLIRHITGVEPYVAFRAWW